MATSAAAPALAPSPPVNPWIIAVAVMFGTFMEVLDTTVVNVSLPHIAGSLSATPEEATWTLTSYIVANAIVLPLTGWLVGVFGRKRLLMVAVAGFTAGSVLCGAAQSLAALVVFRVIQGATGGCLQPLSQAVLLETFPPEKRGKAMALWSVGIVVAPILGPILGGWITESYSWRWVFYINVPVGALSLFMMSTFLHDPPNLNDGISRKVDGWGIGFLVLGIASLQWMLDKGQQEDWFESDRILIAAAVAASAIALFIVRELTTENPVVPLRIFRDATYATGTFLITILGFVLYGSLVILPIFLQTMIRYPAIEAGLATAPRGIGAFLMMPIAGMLVNKVDPRKMLAVGLITASSSLLYLSTLNQNVGYWNIFWPQFIQGTSLGLIFLPLSSVTMFNLEKRDLRYATSMFNLMRNLGGSIGIAAGTVLISRATQSNFNRMGERVNELNPVAENLLTQIKQLMMSAGMDAVAATERAYAMVSGMVTQQAMMVAYLQTFQLFGVVFLFTLPLIFLLKRPNPTSTPPGATPPKT
jgi:MFS transporter, DHA2 family, multidrug resistance protein